MGLYGQVLNDPAKHMYVNRFHDYTTFDNQLILQETFYNTFYLVGIEPDMLL